MHPMGGRACRISASCVAARIGLARLPPGPRTDAAHHGTSVALPFGRLGARAAPSFRHATRFPLTAALGPRIATDRPARGVLADREDHRLLPGAARAHDPGRGHRRPEAAVLPPRPRPRPRL